MIGSLPIASLRSTMLTLVYRDEEGIVRESECHPNGGETVADAVYNTARQVVGPDGYLIAVERNGESVL